MLARLSSSSLAVSWLSPLPPNLARSHSLLPSLPRCLSHCAQGFSYPPTQTFSAVPSVPALSLLRCLIPPFPNTTSNLFPLSTPPALDDARPTRRCIALDFTHLRPARCIFHPRLHSNSILRGAPFHPPPPISTLEIGPSISSPPIRDPRPSAPVSHHHALAPFGSTIIRALTTTYHRLVSFLPPRPLVPLTCPLCLRVDGVIWLSTENKGTGIRPLTTPRPTNIGLGLRDSASVTDGRRRRPLVLGLLGIPPLVASRSSRSNRLRHDMPTVPIDPSSPAPPDTRGPPIPRGVL